MPYLTGTAEPVKIGSFTKPVWLALQVLTGTLRVASKDQDIKNGGGLIYRAANEPAYEAVSDSQYEGYWFGDLWTQGAGATYHWEAHQTQPGTPTAEQLPTKNR
jgi:hypothetical protein